jgi:hypothetical protein
MLWEPKESTDGAPADLVFRGKPVDTQQVSITIDSRLTVAAARRCCWRARHTLICA